MLWWWQLPVLGSVIFHIRYPRNIHFEFCIFSSPLSPLTDYSYHEINIETTIPWLQMIEAKLLTFSRPFFQTLFWNENRKYALFNCFKYLKIFWSKLHLRMISWYVFYFCIFTNSACPFHPLTHRSLVIRMCNWIPENRLPTNTLEYYHKCNHASIMIACSCRAKAEAHQT